MTRLDYGSAPRIAILISGRGSNMNALLEAREAYGYNVVGVIASRGSAPGIALAEAAGVETVVVAGVDHKGDRAGYDEALDTQLRLWGVDIIVLAGFMRILSDTFVEQYPWRIVNIHPSLLPAFPGLDPHGQAISAGVKLSGCTVHFVTVGSVDTGPIIVQVAVPVLPADDAGTLAARVLAEEHKLFPAVIAGLAKGGYFRDGPLVHANMVGDRA